MKDLLRLMLSRSFRRDNLKPKTCFAKNYYIEKNTVCDCKIWCKFPPPGNTPIMAEVAYVKKYSDYDEYKSLYG